MIFRKGFPLVMVFLVLSCDLLRISPYEVETWTPGEGHVLDPAGISVSLLLSHESDRIKTEQAFSLTEDRKTLKGNFSWEGRRLIFLPAAPLETGRDYRISLGTGAQDTKGLSLENKFEASFSTRSGEKSTGIIRTEPEYNGSVNKKRGEFRLFFSEEVNLNSCMDYISFSPSTPGSWRLENDNRTACFIPRDLWQSGELYKVKVEGNFPFASGARLEREYISAFTAGEDGEKPILLKVLALLPGGVEEEISLGIPGDSLFGEYSAWESHTRLCLVFSEPVDSTSVRNLLTCEPSRSLVLVSPPGMASQVILNFGDYPPWGSSFLFHLGPGVKDQAGNESSADYYFKINTSGRLSKPPLLAGIRLPVTPKYGGDTACYTLNDNFSWLHLVTGNDGYPYDGKAASWIELYFDVAPDTEMDLFSLMDLFRVTATNSSMEFFPRSIKTCGFSLTEPRAGWESFHRVEVQGVLTNSGNSGIVTFSISSGLKDKRGNMSTEEFRISLLK